MRRKLWFWLLVAVLVVLLLGLLFGGYRRGTVVNAPSPTAAVSARTVAMA